MLFYVGAIIVVPLALWALGEVVDRLARPRMTELARHMREQMGYDLEPRREAETPWSVPTGQGEPLVLREAERVAGTRWRVWE